ncbi:MAG: hypothetical protein ACI9MC_003073 [Kiritimatiellia bacterium]|jgi:hypothetical protein
MSPKPTNWVSLAIATPHPGVQGPIWNRPRSGGLGPIGTHSAVIEPHTSSARLGGSILYATAAGRRYPDLRIYPYECLGFEGQQVAVVPSRDVVIRPLDHIIERAQWDTNDFAVTALPGLPE